MKLSEIKGDRALDVVADLIEPLAKISEDTALRQLLSSADVNKVKIVTSLIKNHKPEIIEILSIIEGEDVETFKDKMTLITLPKAILDIVNDKEVMNLFTSQVQSEE